MSGVAWGKYLRAIVLGTVLGATPVSQAANCTTGAKAAAQLWNKYDQVIKPLGCAAGTAGAAALSGGVALPAAAATFADCFRKAQTADKATKGMIEAWNNLNKNGWGTIGNRDLRMGGTYDGAVPSVGTRMWITSAPISDPFVRVSVKKRNGGWNNAASTQITVCTYPPSGTGVNQSGEKVWTYEFDSGKQNQGKTVDRVFAVPGNMLTVAIKGESVGKNFKYRLNLERVGNVDHGILIAGETASGVTDYELEASGALSQVRGSFINGHKATIDDNDRVGSRRAIGSVGSGNDAFVVTGEIEELQLDDESAAKVYVDGQPYQSGGQGQADHTVVIDGGARDGTTAYTLSGGGQLTQVSDTIKGFDATIQSNDDVSGTSATGQVGQGVDAFKVRGDVPNVSLDNPDAAAVLVDGERQAGSGGNDSSPNSESAKRVTFELNSSRPGADYKNVWLDDPDPRRCATACADDSRCRAYEYVRPGSQGERARCWLKDTVPGREDRSGNVAGVKKAGDSLSQSRNAVTFELNASRPGYDYKNFWLDEPEPRRCAAACASESRCSAYEYVRPGSQGRRARCWLKDQVPGKEDRDGNVAGVKR